jgi:hypothetical protein
MFTCINIRACLYVCVRVWKYYVYICFNLHIKSMPFLVLARKACGSLDSLNGTAVFYYI